MNQIDYNPKKFKKDSYGNLIPIQVVRGKKAKDVKDRRNRN